MPAPSLPEPSPGSNRDALRADVLAGLTATPKSLPPKYFYDERGSELFDKITRLPEYYLTRAETSILRQHAGQIAALSAAGSLVELGSGTSTKTRLLLSALVDHGTLRTFIPLDVDPVVLSEAADKLSADYPGLQVTPVVGDFEHDLAALPRDGRRMIAFLGSTIGNLEPAARASLFEQVAAVLEPGDTFLLGTDLVKDPARLVRAYDDQAGVTAEFNRNVLVVLNRELHADFAVDRFEHVALWDAGHEWMEMRLRSACAQQVTIKDLGLTISFAAGEELHTEISAKFRSAGLQAELAAAGLASMRFWTDRHGDFGLTLAGSAE